LSKVVLLDTGPLGRLAHPKPKADILAWSAGLIAAGDTLIVPEVADYELRRNLILTGLHASVAELDRLKAALLYVPISTPIMLKAAELWADARRSGHPTADPRELGCDVILAAQALDAGAIVATENVGHLSRYGTAQDWRLIAP
jgi:predicted nucleic acid-binding protein